MSLRRKGWHLACTVCSDKGAQSKSINNDSKGVPIAAVIVAAAGQSHGRRGSLLLAALRQAHEPLQSTRSLDTALLPFTLSELDG